MSIAQCLQKVALHLPPLKIVSQQEKTTHVCTCMFAHIESHGTACTLYCTLYMLYRACTCTTPRVSIYTLYTAVKLMNILSIFIILQL